MNNNFILSFFLVLFLGVSVGFAQDENAVTKNPYVEGESLTYEGKYKRFGFSFSIAELNFTVKKVPDTDHFNITSVARSKGTLTKLFNFKFFQKYESTVDTARFQILKTTKRDEQSKRIRESEADFDYKEKRVIYIETDPNDSSRPPRRVASAIDFKTQDVVSAVYMLRSEKLAVGKTFTYKVSDSGLVYDVPIKITGREKVKSILGKKWCWRIEPEVFGKGRFIEQKGKLTIWVTDDEKKIPLRANLNTKLGKVKISLKRATNLSKSTAKN